MDFVKVLWINEWETDIDVRWPALIGCIILFSDGLDLFCLVRDDS